MLNGPVDVAPKYTRPRWLLIWRMAKRRRKFKPEEISGIMNDFNEPGFLAPTSLYFGTTKYKVIQGEPGAVIRGKKVKYTQPLKNLAEELNELQ